MPKKQKSKTHGDTFRKQQIFMILWFISEGINGATGYELQKHVPMPRSTIYRTLSELEEDGFITSMKQEHKGRLQKRYHIRSKGSMYLKEIREAITGNIAFMFRIMTIENKSLIKESSSSLGRTTLLSDDILQKLESVPFLPVPPVLIDILNYSAIRSGILKAENRGDLVSNLEGLKNVIEKVLRVHEDLLHEIKNRHSLLDKMIKTSSKFTDGNFSERNKILEEAIPTSEMKIPNPNA